MGTVQYVGRSSEGKDYRNSALGPRIPARKLALAQCVNGLMCNGHFRKPLLGSGLTHHSQDLKKKKSNWEKQILQVKKKKIRKSFPDHSSSTSLPAPSVAAEVRNKREQPECQACRPQLPRPVLNERRGRCWQLHHHACSAQTLSRARTASKPAAPHSRKGEGAPPPWEGSSCAQVGRGHPETDIRRPDP